MTLPIDVITSWSRATVGPPLRSSRSTSTRLEETAEILSDPDAIAAIETGLAELQRKETVTLQQLRRELGARRPSR